MSEIERVIIGILIIYGIVVGIGWGIGSFKHTVDEDEEVKDDED